jgi:hypothetical protein
LVIETSFFLLQKLVDDSHVAVAGRWTAWCDDLGWIYFQPTLGAQVAWLQFLYERSCQQERKLLLSDTYSPIELSWWYLGDRCQQLLVTRPLAIVDPEHEIQLLIESGLLLLPALLDVWDALDCNWSRRRTAVSRQLVESFLNWERAVCTTAMPEPQISILLAVLRLTSVEMLARSTDR